MSPYCRRLTAESNSSRPKLVISMLSSAPSLSSHALPRLYYRYPYPYPTNTPNPKQIRHPGIKITHHACGAEEEPDEGYEWGRMRAVRSCFRLFVVGYSNGSVNCRTSGLEDKGGIDLWRSEERNKNANGRDNHEAQLNYTTTPFWTFQHNPKTKKKPRTQNKSGNILRMIEIFLHSDVL